MDGLLDTNVFIHAQTTDQHSEECRQFLRAVQRGNITARLEPLVLHELSYTLPRYRKQMSREQIGEYMLVVLSWPGIHGEKDLLADAVQRWRRTPRLSFTDAYLAAMAFRDACPIYTKNVRELEGQRVSVPRSLPISDGP